MWVRTPILTSDRTGVLSHRSPGSSCSRSLCASRAIRFPVQIRGEDLPHIENEASDMGDSVMTAGEPIVQAAPAKPIRLWPGQLLAVLQWPLIVLPTLLFPGTFAQFTFMFFTPVVAAVGIVLW